MEKKPYHHLPDGTFRNPEGSPVRANDVRFSYRTFIKEKKKIDITFPKDHVIDKKIVKENLQKLKDDDYIAWIGHATHLQYSDKFEGCDHDLRTHSKQKGGAELDFCSTGASLMLPSFSSSAFKWDESRLASRNSSDTFALSSCDGGRPSRA